MHWSPEDFWRDADVYIIGGGDSLRDFDMSLLLDRLTIGCNSAYTLGHQVCDICVFGDLKWWNANRIDIRNYKGLVFTNAPALRDADLPNVLTMHRISRGLDKKSLCWNGNTGASAINLALILGAKRVFLLGFDMKLGKEGKPNWHDHRVERETPEVYPRFLKGYKDVARDLIEKFPDCEIINVNDDSKLKLFPIVSIKEHFGGTSDG